jgi:hypothetical protein
VLAGVEEEEEAVVVVVVVAAGFMADVVVAEIAVGVVDEVLVPSAPCDGAGVPWESEADEQVGDTSSRREVAGSGGKAGLIEDILRSPDGVWEELCPRRHARTGETRIYILYRQTLQKECSLARATNPDIRVSRPDPGDPTQLHGGGTAYQM